MDCNLTTRMDCRSVVAALAALCFMPGARAADLRAATLPTLALSPSPPTSLWTGLYVGTEVFAISRKGQKGLFGGGVSVGYNHEFANKIVVGIQGSAGFSPGWASHGGFSGYDYAATDVKVGYDMGRLMPYVTTGVVLTKPRFGYAGLDSTDSLNNVVNAGPQVEAAGRVGAGVDYALTNNLTVGLSVSVAKGRALLAQ